MCATYHTEDMADIAAICGDEIAQALMERLPGIEIKIPAAYSPSNPLAKLERAHADILIKELAGNKIYIPTKQGRVDTRAQAHKLADDGLTTMDIALALHVSERHIRTLLSTKALPRKVDDRQLDLEDWLGEA